MIDAYERSAERLLEATAEDRDWVLAQIDPEERIRIVAKLRDIVENTGESPISSDTSGAEMGMKLASPIQKQYPQLMAADSAEVERVLGNEPDWLIALLVQDARWPWVEQFLSSQEPSRLESIENWVRAGRQSVKPVVTEKLFWLTNEMLLKKDAGVGQPTAFEDILARLRTRSTSNVPATVPSTP